MDSEEIEKEIRSTFTQFFDKNGIPMPIYRYKGHYIPYSEFTVLALSKLNTVKIRPDDILMCTYPGTGSHWLFEMASMILNGNCERVSVVKEEMLIDWAPGETLEAIKSPRLMSTHLPITFIPQELLKDHKMIFLNRSPKSSMVSFYRHIKKINMFGYNGEFAGFFDLFMKGEVPYGDYFKHSQEMYAFSKDNPNVLIITFEEMKKDPVNAVLLIAKFLEKTVPDKLAESIADMCSFDKMKAEKELVCSYFREASKLKPVGTVYHSGAVDTWKKWLTVEQNEKMEAKIQSEFSDREIKFNF
ncbi:sulfotransferase 1A2-like isoform X1 [Octopus sinensis]|uniref:Sulfotransferase 1A2-like isoform X1 n=1 Tax=Octopus sinensis TaxID=2607531 RepID=A0A6P7S8A2_9MOLL|nr:sulfotransferase 1A2-like isoform X1 [Octopus sinensis]